MTAVPLVLPTPADFDAHVHVLVAGGGAAGLTAALAASHAGADVAIFERHERCEGSSAMSLGAACAAGTAAQAGHGIDDDAATFRADIMATTQGRANPVLAELAATRSGPAIDWLVGTAGVGFELDLEWRPSFGHSRRRMHATPGRSGEDMMTRLLIAAAARAIPIVTQAHVVGLFADGPDRVTGVLVERPDGRHERFGCEALILATCGFGANAAMVAHHIPDMAEARYFGWEGNDGGGIALGAAFGGATADMSAYQGLGLLAEPQGLDVNPKLLLAGGIQVNSEGRRFNNETVDVSGQSARVVAQPGGVAWLLYDQRIHEEWGHLGEYKRLMETGARREGRDVDAIAAAIGVPAAALAETLASIEAVRRGERSDTFGRAFVPPALGPHFCAVKTTGALFHTQGGLLVDASARVVRPDGTSIANLFAAGGAACSIGGAGGSGYLPGAGLCMAITLGWVAGSVAGGVAGSAAA